MKQFAIPQKALFSIREAAKKKSFFSGPTTKRGGEGKGPTIKEKGTFSKNSFFICSR